jgi:hypothetical protein
VRSEQTACLLLRAGLLLRAEFTKVFVPIEAPSNLVNTLYCKPRSGSPPVSEDATGASFRIDQQHKRP